MKYLGTKYFKVFVLMVGLMAFYNHAVGQDSIPASIPADTLNVPQDTLKGKPFSDISLFSNNKGKTNAAKDSVKVEPFILDLLEISDRKRVSYAWHMDSRTFDLVEDKAIDTSLFLTHLVLPKQMQLVTQTHLGNLGSPIQSDDFFSRNYNYQFFFSRGYDDYRHELLSAKHYNVKTPHTILGYSSGGKRKEADQLLHVFHTQNVNRYLNFGVNYDYYNAKGVYENQLTRDNVFSAFASYYKKRVSAQAVFGYTYIRNKENGGLEDDYFIQDTVLESALVPFMLESASTEFRQRSISTMAGYDILTRNVKLKGVDGADSVVVKPLLTAKLFFEANRYTRVYSDSETDSSYYKNFYISTAATHDSVYQLNYTTTMLVELTQLAKYPGLPGLRFWASNTAGNYYYFKPTDFIYGNSNNKFNTSHIGAGVYSQSPYLSYSGSLRYYVEGYRVNDKELYGQLTISPWKSVELPYVKGQLLISDKEPDMFIQNYFSNHFMWANSFDKEQRFMVGGVLGADKWKFEMGYNLARVENYLYFDSVGMPVQADGVTITSAYVQKALKLGIFNFVSKVLWQNNTNKDVLSLPQLSVFGSIFFEYELVKNALLGQLGVSGFYRTKFYADGYMPATGQFTHQRAKKIGDYPFVDVFLNFRWKRANLFFKYEHMNEGTPNNEYFTAYHHPANRRVLKFGLSWIFYN